jgi:hypothetical protein
MEKLLNRGQFEMFSKKFKILSFYFLFMGFILAVIPTIMFDYLIGIVILFILISIAKLLLNRQSLILFFFSFGVNLIGSVILILSTFYLFGKPFLQGGDDELFFLASKDLFLNDFDFSISVEQVPLVAVNYPAYLLLFGAWFELLSHFLFSEPHFLALIYLKVFISSFCPVLLWKINNNLGLVKFNKVIVFIVLMPTLIYFNATLLRESIITFLFLVGIYKTTSENKFIFKLFFIFLISFVIYFIRPVNGFLMVSFFCIYEYLKRNDIVSFKSIIFLTVIVFSIQIFNSSLKNILESINTIQESYMSLTNSDNSVSSIGRVLYNSESFILFPIKLLYYVLSPIPPPFFSNPSIITFILSIGAIYWYLIVFSITNKCFRSFRKLSVFEKSIILIFLLSAIIGVSTSKDSRHLIYIYPLIVSAGQEEINNYYLKSITISAIFLCSIAAFSYFILKILI